MKLAVKECGNLNAPLMVFIHGGGVGGWMWDKQVQHFKGYHVVVPELDRAENTSSFSIETSADLIISLIEEKRKNKPVIAVGFSLGAQVLLAALGKKPDLVDYAMINSALAKPLPFAKVLVKTAALFQPLSKYKAFSKAQAKSLYIDEAHFEPFYRSSSGLNKKELVAMLKESLSFTVPGNFKFATADILVTAGDKERSAIKDSLMNIVKSNPNCGAILFPEVGHGISLAKPELFNRVIENWLAAIEYPEEVMEIND